MRIARMKATRVTYLELELADFKPRLPDNQLCLATKATIQNDAQANVTDDYALL